MNDVCSWSFYRYTNGTQSQMSDIKKVLRIDIVKYVPPTYVVRGILVLYCPGVFHS